MTALNAKQKSLYGLGQFAWAAKDTCFHYFLFFYYTQFLGLSASLAGLAALLALVADGISDPLIGQISDNWKSGKWGRRHPFMIAAVVPFCASLIAIFNPPADVSQTILFIWYLGFAITVRSFLTLFTVPHMALGAELSNDYDERTTISTFRNILGYIGGLSIQVIAWFVLIPTAAAAGSVAMGYRQVGTLAAVIAFCGMLLAIFGTRSRIPHLLKTSSEQQSRPWYFAFGDIIKLTRLPSSRVLIFGTLAMTVTVGIANTMLLHVNNFFYGFSSEQTGIFMLCIFLSLLPASWLAIEGTKRFGKRRATVLFLTTAALLGPLPVMAHLYGLTPPVGSGALLFVICSYVVVHQSFYIAVLNVSAGMLPDVADELELSTGMRQEGVLNSAMMLTQKVTFGLGAFFAGITIDFAGFEGVVSIADVSETMVSRLAWVYGPGLMCLFLVAAYIFSRYPLSEDRFEEIKSELQQAKA